MSRELESIEQIKNILRPSDVPEQGLLCDLLWSDPEEVADGGFGDNDRGVSITFGPRVVKEFLKKNDLDLICRAHQVVEEGYEFFADRALVTVFSAPNYCGEFDNSGAMMKIDENLICSFQILKPMTQLANININNNDQNQHKLPRGVTPPKSLKKQNQQQQPPGQQ